MITKDIVKFWFDYSEGELYWKRKPSPKIKVGERAGCINSIGYRQVVINKKQYYEHRLIFLMKKGFMPRYIDHKDGNPLNNKIENLRACTDSQNQYNKKISNKNTSGIKGVSWCKKNKTWKAQISSKGVKYNLGYFKSIKDAERVVKNKREELHGEFANHG